MKHQKTYNRLRRIEGQIRGIEDMLDKNRPETEILIQLEAAKSSLSSTIANLIEVMLEKGTDGKTVLKEAEVIAMIRAIRNS